MKKVMLSLFAAASAVAMSAPASAAVVFLDSITEEGEFFRFNYVVEFANNEGVETGSSVSIFDFNGYVAGSVRSTNDLVLASTEFTSPDLRDSPDFNDDGSIVNLRFTYTGERQDLSNQSFSGFSALSTLGAFTRDGFSGVSVKTAGLVGSRVFTQGGVGVPAAIPEPATWAMMIGGFGMIGAAARRRTRVTYSIA